MSAYEIEKGVPLPTSGRGRKCKHPVRKMEIGDSYIIPSNKNINGVHVAATRVGIKVCTEKQPDGSYRVWRIA